VRRLRILVLGALLGAGLLHCELAKSGLSSDPPEATSSADAGGGEESSPIQTPDAALDQIPADTGVDASGTLTAGQATDGGPGLGALAPADAGTVFDPVDAAPPLVGRWNIDGPTYEGIDYPGTWIAAPVPGICGPSSYTTASALHGTNDAPLFAGEAFGNPATCSVGSDLPAGKYRVSLLFAENYFGDGCPGGGGIGSRVFDIVIEGTTVLSNFDVFAASGGCLASTTSKAGVPVEETFDVVVADGTIDISLPAAVNNGKISALQVFGPL
jgi:hypothetical protein